MRARAPSVAAALLALAATASAHPHDAGRPGPVRVGGPAALGGPGGGGGGGVTYIVPAATASDANCASSSLPTKSNNTIFANAIGSAISCATPATTTNVASISFWLDGNGPTGTHFQCSVYTFPPGYVAATTTVSKVASGCDTAQGTAANGTTSAWMTLATTGACPLAASTRYLIACNEDGNYLIGDNITSCTSGGVQCNQIRSSVTFGTFPATWVANNQSTNTLMYYMTVQ